MILWIKKGLLRNIYRANNAKILELHIRFVVIRDEARITGDYMIIKRGLPQVV